MSLVEKFSRKCRLCYADAYDDLISLERLAVDSQQKDKTLGQLITDLTGLKTKVDGTSRFMECLPKTICLGCFAQIKAFIKFRNDCKVAEDQFIDDYARDVQQDIEKYRSNSSSRGSVGPPPSGGPTVVTKRDEVSPLTESSSGDSRAPLSDYLPSRKRKRSGKLESTDDESASTDKTYTPPPSKSEESSSASSTRASSSNASSAIVEDVAVAPKLELKSKNPGPKKFSGEIVEENPNRKCQHCSRIFDTREQMYRHICKYPPETSVFPIQHEIFFSSTISRQHRNKLLLLQS